MNDFLLASLLGVSLLPSPTGTLSVGAQMHLLGLASEPLPSVSPDPGLPEGTNPDPGDETDPEFEPGEPQGVVRVVRLVIGGAIIEQVGEATIRNPAAAGGKIRSGLLSIGRHERHLVKEGLPTVDCTIVVDDKPDPVTGICRWRQLAATQTLEGAFLEADEHFAPFGITRGTPWRTVAGRVPRNGHKPLPDFRYEFRITDELSELFSDPQNQPDVPRRALTLDEFPGMDPNFDGLFAPRIIGAAVQDGEGVQPMIVMGRLNIFEYWGSGLDQEVGVGLICLGAVYDVVNGWYSILTWTGETEVFVGEERRPTPENTTGFYYRATVGGLTDAEEPTWPTTVGDTVVDGAVTWMCVGLDNPYVRRLIPNEMYGAAGGLVVPHKPGWDAITGFGGAQYAIWGGRAWTPVFWDLSHPYSKYVEDGTLVLLFEVVGMMTGPLSGTPILEPIDAYIWFLQNLLWHDTDGLNYGELPELLGRSGTYTAIDTASRDAAKAIGEALGGLQVGFSVAPLGEAEDGFERLNSISRYGRFRVGKNRHGQIMFARKDPTAAATLHFDEAKHSLQFEPYFSSEGRGLGVEFQCGKRYLTVEPPPNATPNQPSVAIGGRNVSDWASGLQRLPHVEASAAQQASWGRPKIEPIKLQMDTLRDLVTANLVAEEARDDGAGPGPAYHGIPMFQFTGPRDAILKRAGTDGKTCEIGTVATVTHREGIGATGYVTEKVWVVGIIDEQDDERAAVICEALSAAEAPEEENPDGNLTLHVDASDTDHMFTTINGGGSGIHTGTPVENSRVFVPDDEEDGVPDISLAFQSPPNGVPRYRVETSPMAHNCLEFDPDVATDHASMMTANQAQSVMKPASAVLDTSGKTIVIAFHPKSITSDESTPENNHGLIGAVHVGIALRNDSGTYRVYAFNNAQVGGYSSCGVIGGAINRDWIAILTHDGTTLRIIVIDDTGAEQEATVASGPNQLLSSGLVLGHSGVGVEYYAGCFGQFKCFNAAKTGDALEALKTEFKEKWLGL